MKILDREKFIEEARRDHKDLTEPAIDVFEKFLPLLLMSYDQGKAGKEFDVLPVKEV